MSINTATFDELWLGYCQVMADSVGLPPFTAPNPTNPTAVLLPQWLPPMQPLVAGATGPTGTALTSGTEPQLTMFRSVVREQTPVAIAGPGTATGDTSYTATQVRRLSPAQMLKLRAAIAAVNAMDLRDGDDDVTSRRIVLTDATGAPEYDVEVFGSEIQPFIGGVYVHVDVQPSKNFVAIQLLNPYAKPITVPTPTALAAGRSVTSTGTRW